MDMLARVRSGALRGIDALVVEVEVDVASGLPHTTTVGLPDGAVRESTDRIRAALRNLKAILQKGVAHAESKKFEPALLATTRLAVDMLPLTRQVQIASDAAKGAAARLAGVDPPKFEDNEQTLADLIARVDKTIDYLQSFKPEQLDGSEDRTITIPTPRATGPGTSSCSSSTRPGPGAIPTR